jgi:hypothetical protein
MTRNKAEKAIHTALREVNGKLAGIIYEANVAVDPDYGNRPRELEDNSVNLALSVRDLEDAALRQLPQQAATRARGALKGRK